MKVLLPRCEAAARHAEAAVAAKLAGHSFRPAVSASPVLLSAAECAAFVHIQQALHRGMRAVLARWWMGDRDARHILAVAPRVAEILLALPLSAVLAAPLGCYRPDLLFADGGGMVARICEVNARFTVNGYLLSAALNDAAIEGAFSLSSSSFDGDDGSHADEDADQDTSGSSHRLTGIPAMQAFRRHFVHRGWIPGSPVWCISGREQAHDIADLPRYFNASSDGTSSASSHASSSLEFRYTWVGRVSADADGCTLYCDGAVVENCILELHQDELLTMPDAVLRALARLSLRATCLNPLWTIFLLHDKRALQLLCMLDAPINDEQDEESALAKAKDAEQTDAHAHHARKSSDGPSEKEKECMRASAFVDKETTGTLQRHIVPTVSTTLPQIEAMARAGACGLVDLVVKPALLGKGEGVVFQRRFPRDTPGFLRAAAGAAALSSRTVGDDAMIVQPYVAQQSFTLLASSSDHTRKVPVSWPMVGTLICMDDDCFGPGIFRASSSDTIALSSGGVALVPVTRIPSVIPNDCILHLVGSISNPLPSITAATIRDRLLRDGVAMLQLSRYDDLELHFQRLIESDFAAIPREPVPGSGAVWTVSPRPSDESNAKSTDAKTSTNIYSDADSNNRKDKKFEMGISETESSSSSSSSSSVLARSHTELEFAPHTDASYEISPPRFFALAVCRADKRGGGLSGLARISDAVEKMDREQVDTLLETNVRWRVPPEFGGGHGECIQAPVLMSHRRGRFRRDITESYMLAKNKIPAQPSNDLANPYHHDRHVHQHHHHQQRRIADFAGQKKLLFPTALNRLDTLLQRACADSHFCLPEGAILFLDNHRFVHCRTEIADATRKLLRIRFDFEHPPEVERIWRDHGQNQSHRASTDIVQPVGNVIVSSASLPLPPVQNKQELLDAILAAYPPGEPAGGLYWSLSGGTTTARARPELCTVPSAVAENNAMRTLLRDQLRRFGAVGPLTVCANLMMSGGLYRSLEVFADAVAGATHLPLGSLMDNESIVQFMRRFAVNTLCGLSSRIASLVAHAKTTLPPEQIGVTFGNITTIIHGGELMTDARRGFIASICAPHCRFYGVFGSAEVGVFACTRGCRGLRKEKKKKKISVLGDSNASDLRQEHQGVHSEVSHGNDELCDNDELDDDDEVEDDDDDDDDIYHCVPDGVHIELLDESGRAITTEGVEGKIVATNLLRVHGPRVVRFNMEDRASWCKGGLRITGRSAAALSIPLGPSFLTWNEVHAACMVHFEALSPGAVGQVVVVHPPSGTMQDALQLNVFVPDSDATASAVAAARIIAEEALRTVVAGISDSVEVSVSLLASMAELQTSGRSRKLVAFVDRRQRG